MRRLTAAVLGVLLLGGCGQPGTVVEVPECTPETGTADSGVILMAQSVPTASWVPCVTGMPVGWSFAGLEARNDNARFWLDSDRDGLRAAEIEFTAECDVTGATEVPSDRVGMRRLERVTRVNPGYAGERYYLFVGGCVTYHWDLRGTTRGEPLAAVSQALNFIGRDSLRAQVREDSDGRLELDPPAGGG